jgi:hypothetical protein
MIARIGPLLLLLAGLLACSKPTLVAPSTVATKPSLDSPAGFTRLLEERWPVTSIKVFCIPERRHNPGYQNLVAMGDVWEGNLHEGTSTGFDEISWYATVKGGRVDQFSLGVRRGRNSWTLEGGDAASLQTPPLISPDPKNDWFIGHK